MIKIFYFNFCPAVLHCCSLANIKKIESVQKRAIGYIYNDYVSSYEELREWGNKPLLYVHRIKLILLEVYKIVNMLGPEYLHEMFLVYDSAYEVRNFMNIVMPKFNTLKYIKNSISYTGVKLWNILNTETKQTINIKVFRRFIMLWNGPTRSCFNCTHCSLKYK